MRVFEFLDLLRMGVEHLGQFYILTHYQFYVVECILRSEKGLLCVDQQVLWRSELGLQLCGLDCVVVAYLHLDHSFLEAGHCLLRGHLGICSY